MFDTNKDGFIDLNELRKVNSLIGTTLTSEDLYKFMNEADKVYRIFWKNVFHLSLMINLNFQDGNGKIDYDEFVAMMQQY